MKYGQIACKMNTYSEDVNSNLMKVKLIVMHDGVNLNMTKFSLDSMKKAEESIKNVPILGYVTRDSYGDLDDFDGHNMETRIIDGDKVFEVETYYLEKPIGVIAESCNPRYEEIDGYTYLVVDGYIWKSYSNGAYKLIENNEFKGVSMEINILDGKFDDNDCTYEIYDYRYEGVTVLGDNVQPAMGNNTKITKYSKCADYKKALEDIYKEVYSLESEVNAVAEEVKDVEINEVVEVNPEVEIDVVEETVESEVAETEEVIVTTVEDEESKSAVTISEDGIEVKVEETEQPEEVVEEVNPLEAFSILFDEIPGSLEEIAVKLHSKIGELNSELEVLRTFKAEKRLEALTIEVDNVICEYAEISMDEVKDVRQKVLNDEMDMNSFKKELASLAYTKIKANVKEYSTKANKVLVPIIEKTEENGYEPYGGLFK